MKNIARLLGKSALALLGLLTLAGAMIYIFEYGEVLADLSHAELAFLFLLMGLEWRCLKRTRAERQSITSCIFTQFAYLGALALLGTLFALIRQNGAPPPVWAMLSILAAVQLATPKVNKPQPVETPA